MRSLSLILVILISIAVVAAVLAEDISVGEQMLTYRGIAYGIANGPAGNLYITDWKMGEVWRVDATTGAYTLFSGLGNTLDARPDATGDIWLTSFWNPYLNRINTSTNPVSMTTWDLSAWESGRAYTLSGLAFDDLGRAWFSEWGENSETQLLYRFDPDSNQLCGYTLPGGNHSWYLLYQDPYLWLGDWTQALILRFNTSTLVVTYWNAGTKAEPRGLALDELGNIWWADVYSGKLARLAPTTNALTTFTVPDAGSPNYGVPYSVAVHEGRIFYSAQGDEVGTFGILDPTVAAGSSSTAKQYTFNSAETCKPPLVGSTKVISTTTGAWINPWPSTVWMDVSPVNMPGWIMYEAPGAELPYGISVNTGLMWITDQMYNKLIRVAIPTPALTQSPTPTLANTTTPTPTFTATQTPSSTATKTATPTVTQTATNPPSPTPTKTATKTSTLTASLTSTITQTSTQTPSPVGSRTATHTATQTPSPTLINIPVDKEIKYQIFLPIIMNSPSGEASVPVLLQSHFDINIFQKKDSSSG